MYGTCYFVRFPIIRAQYENTPDSRHQPVEHRFHSTLRRPLSICEAKYGCARLASGHHRVTIAADMVVDAAPIHHLTRAVCVEPLKNEEAAPSSSNFLRPRSSQHGLPMAASAPTPECRRGRHGQRAVAAQSQRDARGEMKSSSLLPGSGSFTGQLSRNCTGAWAGYLR